MKSFTRASYSPPEVRGIGAAPQALVTGANGFIGSFLVERLLQQGWRVRCLVRPSSVLDFLPRERVELSFGDVTDVASLNGAVTGCDLVFHLAGWLRGSNPHQYYAVNVRGTQLLLEAAWKCTPGLRRFVLVSSISAHGPSQRGSPAIEGEADRPETYYGQSKLQAEQAARAFRDRLSVTIVRPPIVYGPRERDFLQIYRLVRSGLRPRYQPDKFYSIIHVDDLIAGLILVAAHEQACGQTYYLSDPQSYSWKEIVDQVAEAVNPRSIGLSLRPWMLKTAAALGDLYNRCSRRDGILSRQKLLEILPECWTCEPARAQRELGFQARVPLADGIRRTAEWYKDAGWL